MYTSGEYQTAFDEFDQSIIGFIEQWSQLLVNFSTINCDLEATVTAWTKLLFLQ